MAWILRVAFVAWLLFGASSLYADYALRDGDTVVFLGDSITAARTYGQIIENYTVLRYPDRKVHFINAGWGGDTAAGGAARLERDVFARGATVLTVAYGVNDIGWGLRADQEHKEKYLTGIRTIVSECRKRNVRVFICSAAITAEAPEKAEEGYLQKMCDEGMALSRELGGHSIDIQRTMRGIQQRVLEANKKSSDAKEQVKLHAADGVHLNELGQLAMAFAILKGLDAPAEVSSATINFETAASVETRHCKITNVTATAESLSFTRLDEGLPINFGLFGTLNFRFVPIPEELNRYMLVVRNLPAGGKYQLTADSRGVGNYTAEQLAKGINIASATVDAWQPGGPWDAQATSLKSLTEARSHLATSELLWNVQLTASSARPTIAPSTAAINAKLEELQHIVAKPIPYRFELKRAEP